MQLTDFFVVEVPLGVVGHIGRDEDLCAQRSDIDRGFLKVGGIVFHAPEVVFPAEEFIDGGEFILRCVEADTAGAVPAPFAQQSAVDDPAFVFLYPFRIELFDQLPILFEFLRLKQTFLKFLVLGPSQLRQVLLISSAVNNRVRLLYDLRFFDGKGVEAAQTAFDVPAAETDDRRDLGRINFDFSQECFLELERVSLRPGNKGCLALPDCPAKESIDLRDLLEAWIRVPLYQTGNPDEKELEQTEVFFLLKREKRQFGSDRLRVKFRKPKDPFPFL